MEKTIAVLAGDGIGEEVMEQTLRVLDVIANKFGHTFALRRALIGGAAYDAHGVHFPDATRVLCQESDAILFGAVGGPVSEQHQEKWKNCEVNALLGIRKAFSFNANFRPVRLFPGLAEISLLRPEAIARGVDILFIRELSGDCYFGEKRRYEIDGMRAASDLGEYTEKQIQAVAHVAFNAARLRRRKVTSVDKANVLFTSKLWREVVHEVSGEYPEIQLEDMLVDNCAMQLIKDPSQFDVILAPNLFGDILSDAGAVLPGSLGLLASASLNAQGFGLYEPPGGSAPDIAGLGVANPIGQILSLALLLRYSFGLEKEALQIEHAVEAALQTGIRTRDIAAEGAPSVSTIEMANCILTQIERA